MADIGGGLALRVTAGGGGWAGRWAFSASHICGFAGPWLFTACLEGAQGFCVFVLQDAMSLITKSTLVCVSIVMAMVLLADATTAAQLSPDPVAAALTQRTYLRGNTDVSGASTKRAAVVTEEMQVGDPSFDAMLGSDYSNGNNPSANCRPTRWSRCP